MVNGLSDEFNRANSQNVESKWHDEPVSNGVDWIGREPVRFQANNAIIRNNQLWISGSRNNGPAGRRTNNNTLRFSHTGAIVRSDLNAIPGLYIEARMRSANTFMSGTF